MEACEHCGGKRTEPGKCSGCGIHGPEDCEDCGKYHMPAHLHYGDVTAAEYLLDQVRDQAAWWAGNARVAEELLLQARAQEKELETAEIELGQEGVLERHVEGWSKE